MVRVIVYGGLIAFVLYIFSLLPGGCAKEPPKKFDRQSVDITEVKASYLAFHNSLLKDDMDEVRKFWSRSAQRRERQQTKSDRVESTFNFENLQRVLPLEVSFERDEVRNDDVLLGVVGMGQDGHKYNISVTLINEGRKWKIDRFRPMKTIGMQESKR